MSADILVYATLPRADLARRLLGAACSATGIAARLELYGSGSLFQRLGPRHAPPLPDLTIWNGPFPAHAAASAGLLQPHQPARVADRAAHDAQWRWTTLDYAVFGVTGSPATEAMDQVGSLPVLALADPERSESGTTLLLATLDRARQLQGDVEQGWAWWQQRARTGMRLFEDEAGARASVGAGASHALTTVDANAGFIGLAPIPNVVGLASNARNADAARRVLDWLCGEQSADLLALSPWQAAQKGLEAALAGAPTLDVAWATAQYAAARRRWAESGFGPTPTTLGPTPTAGGSTPPAATPTPTA